MKKEVPKFEVIVAAIILDSEKKKILIGKRKSGHGAKLLGWVFPGGRLSPGEDIDKALKKKVKLKTGYDVKNVGTFFSRTYEENPGVVSISFLTTVFEGKEAPGDDLEELKWVSVNKLNNYFKIPMHNKLREFLEELV